MMSIGISRLSDVLFVFTPIRFARGSCFIYVICVLFTYIGVQHDL